MKNWELEEVASKWRETAARYLDARNPLEVPNPVVSASRLRHLAGQIEAMLPDRIEPPIKPHLVSVKEDMPPLRNRKNDSRNTH